jgi:hypothetical protein
VGDCVICGVVDWLVVDGSAVFGAVECAVAVDCCELCSRTGGVLVNGVAVVVSISFIEIVDPSVVVNEVLIGFEVKLSGDVSENVVWRMFWVSVNAVVSAAFGVLVFSRGRVTGDAVLFERDGVIVVSRNDRFVLYKVEMWIIIK